jgi:predicted ATPase
MDTKKERSHPEAGLIRRIEVLRYRGLNYVSQDLMPFAILVGPNGAGKSSFLDCVALVSDYLNESLPAALMLSSDESRGRSRDVSELIHNRRGSTFELALELSVPSDLVNEQKVGDTHLRFDIVRYELRVGTLGNGAAGVLVENLWLIDSEYLDSPPRPIDENGTPETICTPYTASTLGGSSVFVTDPPLGWRSVIARDLFDVTGSAVYTDEHVQPQKVSPWKLSYRPGAGRSALAGLPDEPTRFPVASWARDLLQTRVFRLALSAAAMRHPTSNSAPKDFQADDSNLPQAVLNITMEDPQRYDDWQAHVRTILPEIEAVFVNRLPEDNRLYLEIKYEGSDVSVPSWLLSDGTLRLLALTLIPYLPGSPAIYLIEEPEDGLHPKAIEGVFLSLSSVYRGQVLMATHSPLIVGLASPSQLLCFRRNSVGAAKVVRGDQLPALTRWHGQVDLSILFASGVLG